ncbi:MAG: hypothetical protein AAF456_12450 [Planctomycetota bacterium]
MKPPRTSPNFTFSRRRLKYAMIAIISVAVIGLLVWLQNRNLRHSTFFTGYLLMGSILFLTAFNLRKKIPVLPAFGSATMWMQLHIYVGLSTFAVFGFHIAWRIPNGMFEGLLAFLYLAVALSGVYGLYATRIMPRRLAALKEEVIYERIPALQRQLATSAKRLVLEACESTDVLARFYVNKLATFFERPRSLAYMINPSGRRRKQLLDEITDLNRYLGEQQRPVGAQLSEMVQQKDDLDYHRVVQGRLKLWLFVHIGMTYSLLIISIIHGIMAHAFAGGLR